MQLEKNNYKILFKAKLIDLEFIENLNNAISLFVTSKVKKMK